MISVAQGKRITKEFEIAGRLYAFDSSTINLFLIFFWCTSFRKAKGGLKIHTLFGCCDGAIECKCSGKS